ncbi:MAG: hypothetical protein K1X86_09880 [Ignavibacteria bacterium]|nr:hypothetical protein [Ignavibacteria bacterium]
MENITISKAEYKKLLSIEKAYTKLTKVFIDSAIKNSVEPVVSDFEKSGLYTKEFIKDLKDGLSKSSYKS